MRSFVPSATVPGAVVLLGLLCLAQALILSVLRAGSSYDGAEQLLYTQYLDWGYGRSQPPLYTWLLIGMQQLFGVSQLAENLLKFGALFAGFVAIRQITLQLGARAAVASAAMVSVFLVEELGWEAQRNYAHSILLFALMGGFALAYLVQLRRATTWRFALLGLLLGAMLLSKYNSAIFVATLVMADLSLPQARIFLRRASLLVWLVAALLLLPHVLWALRHPEAVFALSGNFGGADGLGVAETAVRAFGKYLIATVGLLLPLALVMGIVLARGRAGGWPALPGGVAGHVLLRWAGLLWGVGLVGAVASEASVVRMRWLLPLLVPLLPLVVAAVLAVRPRATRWVLATGIVIGGLCSAGQWLESTRFDARKDYDYRRLADGMVQAGLPLDIVTVNYPIFANLRLYGVRAAVAPELPDPRRVLGDEATAVWVTEWASRRDRVFAYARELGLCPVPGEAARSFVLLRRHGDGALPVMAQRLSRAACDG